MNLIHIQNVYFSKPTVESSSVRDHNIEIDTFIYNQLRVLLFSDILLRGGSGRLYQLIQSQVRKTIDHALVPIGVVDSLQAGVRIRHC